LRFRMYGTSLVARCFVASSKRSSVVGGQLFICSVLFFTIISTFLSPYRPRLLALLKRESKRCMKRRGKRRVKERKSTRPDRQHSEASWFNLEMKRREQSKNTKRRNRRRELTCVRPASKIA
jgi:hypothetical protein